MRLSYPIDSETVSTIGEMPKVLKINFLFELKRQLRESLTNTATVPPLTPGAQAFL
jgi:hypothetical protein